MITRLSTMSEKQKEDYMKYYEDVMISGVAGFKMLKPADKFDENGLRFPIKYLNEFGKNIIFLVLELIAEYADVITTCSIDENDKGFIYHQIIDLDFDIEKMYDNLNATSIGNIAYICLNCKDEKVKLIAEKILNEIFVKAKGILLNQINEAI